MARHGGVIAAARQAIAPFEVGGFLYGLKWRVGPLVQHKFISDYGMYYSSVLGHHSCSNTLVIQTQLLEKFARGLDRAETSMGITYLSGVTVLHELIHWADEGNGKVNLSEAGSVFERALYGRVVVGSKVKKVRR